MEDMTLNSHTNEQGQRAVEPAVMLPLARIQERLTAALSALRDPTPESLSRAMESAADALDGLRAQEVVRSCTTPSSVAEASATVLAAQRAEPVHEWLLIPFGPVRVERPVSGGSFEFTRAHAESAVRWFEQLGRKLAIDYEHQSFDRLNTRPDGLRPAAGWVGGIEVRDDGLWAVEVTWTERACELLATREYCYFSPVIYWTDDEHTDIAALGPVALTNDPAMHAVPALAASRELDDGMPMRAAVGMARSTAPERAEAVEDEETLSVAALAREELDAAQAEVARLQRELRLQAADAFIERGLRAGKITDATSMDWREDYLRDAERTEVRLARSPALLPPGRVLALDGRGEVAAAGSAELEFARHADALRGAGVEVADLTAYERAVLAGRVRRGGQWSE